MNIAEKLAFKDIISSGDRIIERWTMCLQILTQPLAMGRVSGNIGHSVRPVHLPAHCVDSSFPTPSIVRAREVQSLFPDMIVCDPSATKRSTR